MKQPFDVHRILIPIDFSSTSMLALEHAALFCKKFKSTLHLLHVYKGRELDILPDVTAARPSEDDLKDKITIILQKHASELATKYGIETFVEVREGSIAKEINHAAEESKTSLIMMGTHGTSGIEEFFIGSNAYKVVTASNIPVLTMRGHIKHATYKKIFLGIDSSKHTRDKVSHVATLAAAFSSEVHISALITEDHEEENKIFNLKIKQIMDYFDHRNIKYVHDEVHGDDISEMVIKKATDVNADLIAIMTEQEASTGLFVGSYAQRIVNHSKIPVLTITPFEIVDKFSQSDLGGDYRPFYI